MPRDEKIQLAEKWIIRIVFFIVIACMGYIGRNITTSIEDLKQSVVVATVQVATIKKELELVKPTDVLSALNQLEKTRLRKEDVELIVSTHSPWINERKNIEERIYRMEERIRIVELEVSKYNGLDNSIYNKMEKIERDIQEIKNQLKRE